MEDRPAVRVIIFGNEYTIRGEANGDYIRELAHYVDGKMQEIAKNANLAIPLKVSILAAINLADEVYRLRAARVEKAEVPVQTELPTVQAPVPTPPVPEEIPEPVLPELTNIPSIPPDAILGLARHIEEALKEH